MMITHYDNLKDHMVHRLIITTPGHREDDDLYAGGRGHQLTYSFNFSKNFTI